MKTHIVTLEELKNFAVMQELASSTGPKPKRLSFFVKADGTNPGYRVESWDSTLPIPSTQRFVTLAAAVDAYNAI